MVAREQAKMGLGSCGTCIPAAQDPRINRNLPELPRATLSRPNPDFPQFFIFWVYSAAIQKPKIGGANVET